ncbi:MAG: hypothetical protein UHD64_05715 [Bacteroidales bacterium]|nr:hypothetical protein [Bacteroidales bacterium]
MTINPSDIHYSYDTRGYMMYYKGKPIGGAGLGKGVSGCRANLKLFKEQAEIEKRRILKGFISEYMLKEIRKIDEEESNV